MWQQFDTALNTRIGFSFLKALMQLDMTHADLREVEDLVSSHDLRQLQDFDPK